MKKRRWPLEDAPQVLDADEVIDLMLAEEPDHPNPLERIRETADYVKGLAERWRRYDGQCHPRGAVYLRTGRWEAWYVAVGSAWDDLLPSMDFDDLPF